MAIQILNSTRVTDKIVITEISGHIIKVVDYRLADKDITTAALFVLTPNGIEAYKEIEFDELPEDLRQAMDQILVRFKN